MTKFLSKEQIKTFQNDGFLVIPQMFNPQEMTEITNWINEVYFLPEVSGKYMFYYEDNLDKTERVLARIENFYPYHQGLNQLMNSEKVLNSLEDLFEEKAVLFKDKINFKMPQGQGFTPHQDSQAGWEDYAQLFITMLISIDETTVENGCLELVKGYHKQGLIGELWQPLTEENMEGMEFIPYPTKAGDVVFFDSYAPHRSAPNFTNKPRRVLYITYNKNSEGDHRVKYYEDKRKNYPPDMERETGKNYVFKV